jgi:hypothetical protein
MIRLLLRKLPVVMGLQWAMMKKRRKTRRKKRRPIKLKEMKRAMVQRRLLPLLLRMKHLTHLLRHLLREQLPPQRLQQRPKPNCRKRKR